MAVHGQGEGGVVEGGAAPGEGAAERQAERSAAHRARLRELVRVEQNVLVRAGAGTGKTFSLVACVLHQLAGLNRAQVPVAPARVCAITFTEKAAAEMHERVQNAVEALIEAPDSHAQARLLYENAAELRVEPPSAEHWRRVRRDLGSMVISTFHGFCAQVLREYPVEAGVEPGFVLTDELQTGALLSELIENIVYERLAEGDPACLRALRALPVRQGAYGQALAEVLGRVLRRLREDGLQVSSLRARHRESDEAQHRQEHARCLKVLAQQKTLLTMLWARLDPSMLAKGSDADRVLLADLKAFAQEADELQATIEALELSQLSDHLAPLSRYVRPLRRRARQARILSGLSGHKGYRIAGLPTFQERYLERMLRHTADQLRQDVLGLLDEVSQRYAQLKQSMGALDFTDLVVLARDALRDEPAVRRALKQRFEIVLVDEFQDTNDVQLDLVMMLGEVLAEEAALTSTQSTLETIKLHPSRLFLVGDPKQSIYNFRGADVGVFNRVERHLVGRAQVARRYALQQNRRSLPALLEFGNRWFADVLGEPQVNDPDFVVRFTAQDRLEAAREVVAPVLVRAGGEEGSAPLDDAASEAVAPGEGAQSAASMNVAPPEEGRRAPVVEYLAFPPGHAAVDEARAVARWIERYVRGDGGHQVYNPSTHQPEACRYGHVAVLLRHFRHLAAYQDALQRLQIPYFVVKGRGFYGCAEVRDLHMLLRLLLDPDDGLALVGVLRSPLALVSDAGLLWLQRGARGRRRRALTLRAVKSLLDSPPQMAPDDLDALRRFVALYDALSEAAGRLGPRGVLSSAIRMTRLREQLAGTFRGRQKIGNLEKLLELAGAYERSQVGHLAGFSRRLAQLIAEEPREPEGQVVEESADVVRIMTVHQSKGLEFPVVVLPEVHAMVGRPASGTPIQYDRVHGLQVRMRVRHMGQVVAELETEGFDALRRSSSAREEAEERRLVYVAATRARDLLWLSGRGIALREDGSRVEARRDNPLVRLQSLASLSDPAVIAASRERAHGELLALTEADERAQEDAVEAEAEAQRGWRAALSGLTPPVARRPCPTYAVTQLADYHRCPRRYYYAHVVGLTDHASPDDAREWTLTSHAIRDRGTAAHAVLEHLDYEAYVGAGSEPERLEVLRSTLRPMNVQLPRAAREEVLEALRAALGHSEWSRRLASAQVEGRLERERPAVVHLRGESGEVYVKGRLDMLLTLEQGPTLVLDHKYCARSEAGLAPHRFQLAVYALMVQPHAEAWVAGVFFLKDGGGEPALLQGDGEELEWLRLRLPEIASELTAAHLHDHWPRGDDRSARVCRSEGCAFAQRCWGDATA